MLADHAQSDTAFLRLALAHSALHSEQTARFIWIMAARFEALTLRGSDFFGREQARFALELQHDPQAALGSGAAQLAGSARALGYPSTAAGCIGGRTAPSGRRRRWSFLQKARLEDPIIEPLAQELRGQLKRALGAKK